MLAEVRVPASVCTLVADCKEVTPNMWKCTQRVCQLSARKIIQLQLFFLQLCGSLFSSLAMRVQFPDSNSEMGSNNCLYKILGKEPDDCYTWKDEKGETCINWELTLFQHHKIRTNVHPDQCCQSTPEMAQGAWANALGLWSQTSASALVSPTPVMQGRGKVGTGLTYRMKKEERSGREPAYLLWDPNQLLAALNSSVWVCWCCWCWIIPAKKSVMRVY